MLPKKTVLKETPTAPVVKKSKPRKNEYLRECFHTIINRELLHMNVKKVNDILINDLHVNLKSLPYRLQCVLAECLCHYMKVWPGWTKYEQQCRTDKSKRDYFEKFRQYLSFKMNYIIKNEQKFWNDPPPDPTINDNKVSKEVQTDNISKSQKPEAPYNLVISGQPNVLNNIVFIELDNNIVIKQHAEKPWKTLTIPEFLNYSFVYVEVTLPDIHLSRSNLHEFQRYITECGDTATCPEVDYITYIRKTNRNLESKVYTFNFLSAYFAQFLVVMKQIPGINMVRVSELDEIFKEFLKDIQSTNLQGQTMATATAVCYNIGGNKYIRNKKMVINNQNKKDTNAINFCEILIPRTSYTLHEFTAEEDPSTECATFKSLNEILCLIKKGKQSDFYSIVETINNCVSYQCILCPKTYQGEHAYVEMLDHFRFLHKGEQSVLCFKCRRQFEVPKLSGDRWAHVCEPKTTGACTSTTTSSNITTTTAAASATTTTTVGTTASLGSVTGVIVAPNNAAATASRSGVLNSSNGVFGISENVGNLVNVGTSTETPTATVIRSRTNTPSNVTNSNVTNATNNVKISIPTSSIVSTILNSAPIIASNNSPVNSVTLPINTFVGSPKTITISNSSNAITLPIEKFININRNMLGENNIITPLTCASVPLTLSSTVISSSTSNLTSRKKIAPSIVTGLNVPSAISATSSPAVTPSVINYIVAPPVTAADAMSTDLFANFSINSVSTVDAGTSNSAPAAMAVDSINLAPSTADSESATKINFNSILNRF